MKVFNLISRTNETRHTKWHETCKCKEFILKVYVTKDLVGIQVIVSVNVINLVILENIWIIQILSAGKNYFIS